jgi:EmrB/QacA subfamily drug resistance transporter
MKPLGSRKWWALAALALVTLAVGVDGTDINIALPTLATDLHASNTQLQWFVDAYLLIFASLLLPAGLLGDRFGRKKMLLIGLIIFGVSSAACAYATSANTLIGARAVLGLGGAFLMPLSLSVLPVLFTPEERTKAMSIWVAASAVSFPIGPVLGGWLLNTYWWGSVFLINVPVTIVALVAVFLLVPESRSETRPRIDVFGVITSSIGLASLTYGVIEAGAKGWGAVGSLVPIVIGLATLTVFILWEHRLTSSASGQPLIDLALFRSASFTWGTLLATLVTFAMFGVLFVLPQYFQEIGGVDAFGTGIRLLPLIAGLLLGAGVANVITARAGAKLTVAIGFALLAAGLGMGALTSLSNGYGFTAIWIIVVGLSLGFVMPTAMDAALSALSAERSGVGSALMLALRQVGGVIGVALLGTMLNSAYRGHLDLSGVPNPLAATVEKSLTAGKAVAQQLGSTALLDSVRSSFIYGMDVMLGVCGIIALVGIVLTLVFLPRQSDAAAEATPERVGLDHEVVVR